MKVINLFSGPGSGKSTTAAGLFFLMKLKGYNVELITEYAKQLVWQERKTTFEDQLYILAKQNHKLQSLKGKVDYAITDSPLLLSLVYQNWKIKVNIPSFGPLITETFKSYDNLNFYIKRVKKYQPIGRNQNESEAKELDKFINLVLARYNYVSVNGDKNAPKKILSFLEK